MRTEDVHDLALITLCLNLTDDGFAVLDDSGAILIANHAFTTHLNEQPSPIFSMPAGLSEIVVGTKTVLHFKRVLRTDRDSGI